MKPERSDVSDLKWKRPETKADESRGERRFSELKIYVLVTTQTKTVVNAHIVAVSTSFKLFSIF
jgi:hypothetical protein